MFISKPFLIYGVKLDENIWDYFQMKFRHECENEKCIECGQCYENESEYFSYCLFEYYYKEDDFGIRNRYIGLSLDNCKHNETMGDFKRRVVELVNSYTQKRISKCEFRFYEDIIYIT